MIGHTYEAGQFITFNYTPPARDVKKKAGLQVELIADRTKEVFVLNPLWQGQMHAIDLSKISPAEGSVLRAIMDQRVVNDVKSGRWPLEGVPDYPLIRDILKRMDPIELIKNPIGFYQRFVKPFLRNKDAYRKYFPSFISGVRVIERSSVVGQVVNPKPLFKR
jgi:hypothetical protein